MFKIATLKVTGDDAFDFLQGQLTNDLGALETDAEILAAWCNPKGRVIWFGTVWKTDGGFALSVFPEMADSLVRQLTLFRFRSKVDFDIVDEGQTVEEAFLIESGFPWVGTAQSEQFTPHMLNLDLLGAVSFDKGCYTGQEIVARTHYKGATKRRTMRFEASGPVAEGDKVQLAATLARCSTLQATSCWPLCRWTRPTGRSRSRGRNWSGNRCPTCNSK